MRYPLLLVFLFAGFFLHSQASVTFILPDIEADDNTRTCLPVTVKDFTSGLDFSFTILTDPNGALFSPTIRNITDQLPNFTASNFDTDTYAAEGLVVVRWQSYPEGQPCNSENRQSLDDGTVLFEICYQVDGPIASRHPVQFFDKPDDDMFDNVDNAVPISFRKECNPNVTAFPATEDGSVTIGVRPVVLDVTSSEGIFRPGDTYCVDVVASSGFDDLKSYQFGINFDATVLEPVSIDPNEVLPQNLEANYVIRDDKTSIYAIWAPFPDNPQSLPDGTRLVTVCFEIIGDCGDRTDISIGEQDRGPGQSKAPVDATGTGSELTSIPVITGKTRLIVDNCNSRGFDVVVGCPNMATDFGMEVCVEMRAGDDFIDMTDIDYQVSWDPNILEFTRIQNAAAGSRINIADDFTTDQVDNGRLFFDWDVPDNAAFDLAEGASMYEICFTVVGFGGVSPILVNNFNNNIRSLAQPQPFNGVNPTNCSVEIVQPDGVALRFPASTGFREGQTECFDLKVDGFTDVENINFLIGSPTKLTFSTGSSTVSGLTATNLGGVAVQISYDGPAFSLPDGATLLNLCYDVVPGSEPDNSTDCGTFEVFPNATIGTTESMGSTVPIEIFPGQGCVLFPNGYGLVVSSVSAPIDSAVCVPVSVTQFSMITSTNVRFTFDPSRLSFTEVQLENPWLGLGVDDFDTNSARTGIVDLSWSGADASVNPANDTTVVFNLCFVTSTDVGCTEVEAGGQPGNTDVTTLNGEPGSIVYRDGEVCAEDRLVINEIITVETSCTGEDDGGIFFDIVPRPNNEDIFIRVDNPFRNGVVGDTLRGLLPGTVNYTLYNARGTVSVTGSAVVGTNATNGAVADAGPDGSLSCTDNAVANITSRNNVGVTWRLFRQLETGGNRAVDNGTVASDGNVFATVMDPGTYFLTVTSAAGCTDTDTVVISSMGRPEVVITEDLAFLCGGPSTLTLSGEGSSDEASAGTSVSYLWERVTAGGEVVDTAGTTLDIDVSEAGRYRLTVGFPQLGCSNSLTTLINDDRDLPASRLVGTSSVGCDGSPATLTIGPPEDDVNYSWFRLGSSSVLSTSNTYSTDEIGDYEVLLENTVNGCSRRDTVAVTASAGAPVISGDMEVTLNCSPDTTQLRVSYTNTDGNTQYRWTGLDGGIVLLSDNTLPEPRVVRAGRYRVIVNNAGCLDSAFFTVTDPLFPTADAGPDGALDCGSGFTLEGSGSDPAGGELTFQWSRDREAVPMGAAPTVVVDQPGIYVLQTTVATSGCTATDTVEVTAPVGFPVFEVADTVSGLGCAPSTLTLSVMTEAGTDYSFSWLDPAGNQISTADTAVTDVFGLHTLEVTDNATNCVGSEQILVDDESANPPRINFTQNAKVITCETNGVLLDASSSPEGEAFTYVWSSSNGGEAPSEQGNDSLRVFTTGTYTLTLTNTETNCTSTASVDVTEERDDPNVTPLAATPLDCQRRETEAGIRIDDQPNDYLIQWSGPAGVDDLPSGQTSIMVFQGGTYNAIVINPETSCITTVSVQVPDLKDSIADIRFMPVDSFTCGATDITIDASGTTIRDGASTILWTGLDGNAVTPSSGSLVVTVNGAGDYELAIADASGCTVRDTISVTAGGDAPVADAGPPLMIECGEMPLLDGTASTPPDAGVTYAWTVTSGSGSVISGGATQTPVVSGPGVYQLTVENTDGCSDTDRVEVTISEQAMAMLPADFNTCDEVITVTGNLPAGTTGSWTSFNGANAVFTAENNVATITDLAEGIALVYTLSAPGCESYSADTVTIKPEVVPVATDDVLTVSGADNVGTVNVLDNDLRAGPVTVRILDQPEFGEIVVSLNGEVTFEAPIGLTAVTALRYEVCSNACPDLCAEAVLRITSESDGQPTSVFNAFTPNGDGMNERFVFQILQLRPDEFPDSELTVFNRWGNVVYEATPYNNDWDGTGNSGMPVPEGTYYYILRLNIGEGEIIRGDVTIVR